MACPYRKLSELFPVNTLETFAPKAFSKFATEVNPCSCTIKSRIYKQSNPSDCATSLEFLYFFMAASTMALHPLMKASASVFFLFNSAIMLSSIAYAVEYSKDFIKFPKRNLTSEEITLLPVFMFWIGSARYDKAMSYPFEVVDSASLLLKDCIQYSKARFAASFADPVSFFNNFTIASNTCE